MQQWTGLGHINSNKARCSAGHKPTSVAGSMATLALGWCAPARQQPQQPTASQCGIIINRYFLRCEEFRALLRDQPQKRGTTSRAWMLETYSLQGNEDGRPVRYPPS